MAGNDLGAFFGDNSGPEQVSHVGRHRVDWFLVPVEPHDVVPTTLVRPEVFVHACPKRVRLALEATGQRLIVEELSCHARDTAFGIVDVALNLHGRDRQKRNVAVAELDAVPRVLPTLVAQPLRRSGPVLDVAVAIAITELVNPREGREHTIPALADELIVSADA